MILQVVLFPSQSLHRMIIASSVFSFYAYRTRSVLLSLPATHLTIFPAAGLRQTQTVSVPSLRRSSRVQATFPFPRIQPSKAWQTGLSEKTTVQSLSSCTNQGLLYMDRHRRQGLSQRLPDLLGLLAQIGPACAFPRLIRQGTACSTGHSHGHSY